MPGLLLLNALGSQNPVGCNTHTFAGSSRVPEDAWHCFLRAKTKIQGPNPHLEAELFLAAAHLGPVGSRSSEALEVDGEAPVLWSPLIIQTRAIYRLHVELGGMSVIPSLTPSTITVEWQCCTRGTAEAMQRVWLLPWYLQRTSAAATLQQRGFNTWWGSVLVSRLQGRCYIPLSFEVWHSLGAGMSSSSACAHIQSLEPSLVSPGPSRAQTASI